jgi:hypothetical protein
MVEEIIDNAMAKQLAYALFNLPAHIGQRNFWRAYKKWHARHEGPLLGNWTHVDCPSDFMHLAERLGMSWSEFRSATVGDLVTRANQVYKLSSKK